MKKLLIFFIFALFCFTLFGSTTAKQIDMLAAGLLVNNKPLSGGKVYFYSGGSNFGSYSAPWLDKDKTMQASNPVILDANGRAIVYGDGFYDIAIKTSVNATIASMQNFEYKVVSVPNPLTVASGGTGATTVSGARSNLGLAIGSNVQAWSSVLDALVTANLNKAILVNSSAPIPSITVTANGDVELVGNLKVGGAISSTAGLSITGNITVNSGNFTQNPGLIHGVNISYAGTTVINLSPGYICIDGVIHSVPNALTSGTISGPSANVYYVYIPKSSAETITSSAQIETSGTQPVWDTARLGWYKNGDNQRRCVGFIYFSGLNVIQDFVQTKGNYRYKVAPQKTLIANTSVLLSPSNLPAIPLLFYGRAHTESGSFGSDTAYVNLYFAETGPASITSVLVAENKLYNSANGSLYGMTTFTFDSLSGSFYYYLSSYAGAAPTGWISVDGFYWSPDKE